MRGYRLGSPDIFGGHPTAIKVQYFPKVQSAKMAKKKSKPIKKGRLICPFPTF